MQRGEKRNIRKHLEGREEKVRSETNVKDDGHTRNAIQGFDDGLYIWFLGLIVVFLLLDWELLGASLGRIHQAEDGGERESGVNHGTK
jgi:hypothetical protein